VNSDATLRTLLTDLANGDPPVGVDLDRQITRGRRRIRQRRLAAGAGTLAVAAVVGAVIAVPAALGGLPHHTAGQRAGDPGGAGHSPQCGAVSAADWAYHEAYTGAVRAKLPQIDGTLTDTYRRDSTGCLLSPRSAVAVWRVAVGDRVGSIETIAFPGTRGLYRRWQHGNPCAERPGDGVCSVTRHGGMVVESRRFRTGKAYTPGDQVEVTAIWPDDTQVTVTVQARADGARRPLTALPLTERQAIALALESVLRG
jgi:hypothetical protein